MSRPNYGLYPEQLEVAAFRCATRELQMSPRQRLVTYGRLLHYTHAEIAGFVALSERTVKEHSKLAQQAHPHLVEHLYAKMTRHCYGERLPSCRTPYPYVVPMNYAAVDAMGRSIGLSPQQRRVLAGKVLHYKHTKIGSELRLVPDTVRMHWAYARRKWGGDAASLLRATAQALFQPPGSR